MLSTRGTGIKRNQSARSELLASLVDSLDFSFFNNIYNSYNTIWQMVLKLPAHGDNLCQKQDFIEVLQKCKVIQSHEENVFCAFLFFSCSKPQSVRNEHGVRTKLDLLDFRILLKSVLICLKRQALSSRNKVRSSAAQSDHEKVFNAEMFIIDHFWHSVVKNTLTSPVDPRSKGKSRRGQSANASTT